MKKQIFIHKHIYRQYRIKYIVKHSANEKDLTSAIHAALMNITYEDYYIEKRDKKG